MGTQKGHVVTTSKNAQIIHTGNYNSNHDIDKFVDIDIYYEISIPIIRNAFRQIRIDLLNR